MELTPDFKDFLKTIIKNNAERKDLVFALAFYFDRPPANKFVWTISEMELSKTGWKILDYKNSEEGRKILSEAIDFYAFIGFNGIPEQTIKIIDDDDDFETIHKLWNQYAYEIYWHKERNVSSWDFIIPFKQAECLFRQVNIMKEQILKLEKNQLIK